MLKSLEEALSEVQRVDAKAQSAFDLKKQNIQDETKKRKELVKSMEEVITPHPPRCPLVQTWMMTWCVIDYFLLHYVHV